MKASDFTIAKETITIIPQNGEYPFIRYEWKCPQCGGTVHGDQRKDTIFEIRHDPICVDCRVKNGEMSFNGSRFEHIRKAATV